MSDERESRIYEGVLQAALWGTNREEILQTLQANGITGQPAEAMFRRAWGERTTMLRGEGVRKAVKGALLAGAGVALFCVFWYGFGFTTRLIFVASVAAGGCGLWWLSNGVMDVLLASTKDGPVGSDS